MKFPINMEKKMIERTFNCHHCTKSFYSKEAEFNLQNGGFAVCVSCQESLNERCSFNTPNVPKKMRRSEIQEMINYLDDVSKFK